MEGAGSEGALEWLRARATIGDMILIGSGDPVARIIQRGTGSPFSHAAIVTDDGMVTEAYDVSLTVNELDEGLYHTSFEKLLARTSKLRTILVLRPPGFDLDRLKEAAHRLHFHSPTYPTLGASLLSICRMCSEIIRIPPPEPRRSKTIWWVHRQLDRGARAQVHFIGDGIRRVHCSESVVRIYQASGVTIRLPSPVLGRSMRRAAELHPVESILTPNNAKPGVWKGDGSKPAAVRLLANTYQLAEELRLEIGRRLKAMHTAEPADYVFPGDLAKVEGFEEIGRFSADRSRTRSVTSRAVSWRRASTDRLRGRFQRDATCRERIVGTRQPNRP